MGTLGERRTNASGRIQEWDDAGKHRGLYRIVFDTDLYFTGLGMPRMPPTYPEVTNTFQV
ncbi:hydroxyisourate hydrolase [Streptomyces violaceusniger]|uniref:hydroxyisourate hydrolase n=1 Tax=Streptomyces violaceusniger TaxID=68280 RepID=UPI0001E4E9BD|nr:hydroxyisourate hydrolase [Streptomyces violaceusniger]